MTKREKIADSLLKPINPSIIIVLGIYTIVWGLWIISPFWSVFTQAPLYSAMASFAGEWFWGTTAIISGVIVAHGALKPRYRNIQLGAFIGFFHWFAIAILYFLSDWQSTGGLTSFAFAAYSAIIWVNIKINKEHFDG